MEKAFYTISLYVDEDENLIGIPCGESDKYGIDKVHLLKAPYSEEQLEQFIEEVIDSCYSKKHMTRATCPPLRNIPRKRALLTPQRTTP
mgnify:CR=1 FL=1